MVGGRYCRLVAVFISGVEQERQYLSGAWNKCSQKPVHLHCKPLIGERCFPGCLNGIVWMADIDFGLPVRASCSLIYPPATKYESKNMQFIHRIVTLSLSSALLAGSFALPPAFAADAAQPVAERQTFDGKIRNNSLSISPDETMAVVSYSERPEIIVYSLSDGRVRGTLGGFVTPRNIDFAPDGGSFYVSDSSLGEVVRIDAHSLKPLSRMAAGPGAFGTVLSKDGRVLFVNNQASNTVTRYETASGKASAVITGFAQPRQGVRLSPDDNTLYVTNFFGDKVTVVDVPGNKVVGEINGFNKIRAISVSADGKKMFAANSGSNNVAVVDLARREIIATVAVGKEPYGAALSPDGRFVYSGNLADNSVSVIDVETLGVVATIKGFKQPRQAIVFTKDNRQVYVLNEDLSISKVDRATQKIVATIEAGNKVK